jgi:hypothetical protein
MSQNRDIPSPPVIRPAVINNVMASAAQVPQVIIPPVLTSQPPITNHEHCLPIINPIDVVQVKEQPQLNEVNPNILTHNLSNINSTTSNFTPTNQMYSTPSISIPHFPLQKPKVQNSSIPDFQVINSQYSPQQLSSTSEDIKPFGLPQATTLSPFTSQESTTVCTLQEPATPPVYSSQLTTTQELTNHSSTEYPLQSSYSQYHSSDIGSTTTITDVSNCKEINNYFTQFQTEVNPSNSSSTIPMFSVKNFPQMSPLAQPLGTSYTDTSNLQSQLLQGNNYPDTQAQFQPVQPAQYQPGIYPGMPLTTPISLPGMPPITVSATLPYSAIESLQNEHKKKYIKW